MAWLNHWGINENDILHIIDDVKNIITSKFKDKFLCEKNLVFNMSWRVCRRVFQDLYCMSRHVEEFFKTCLVFQEDKEDNRMQVCSTTICQCWRDLGKVSPRDSSLRFWFLKHIMVLLLLLTKISNMLSSCQRRFLVR